MATTARQDPPDLREQTWQLWEMFRAGQSNDIVDGALEFFFAPGTFDRQPKLIANYRTKVTNYSQEQAEGIYEVARAVFARTDISKQLDAIKAPVLAIAANEDLLAPPAELKFIASRIPNSRLAIIDEASHLLAVEKPEQVSQIVRAFLLLRKAARDSAKGNGKGSRVLVLEGPVDPFFGLRWGLPPDNQEWRQRPLLRVRRQRLRRSAYRRAERQSLLTTKGLQCSRESETSKPRKPVTKPR